MVIKYVTTLGRYIIYASMLQSYVHNIFCVISPVPVYGRVQHVSCPFSWAPELAPLPATPNCGTHCFCVNDTK